MHQVKAYDLLVQAESGLVAVSGVPGPRGRIGVSICDTTAGMNALIGIQQVLSQRERTGIQNEREWVNFCHSRAMPVNGRTVQMPATPYVTEWDDQTFSSAPRVSEHRDLPGDSGARPIGRSA